MGKNHIKLKTLKNQAWKLCSEYNRRKDADWKGEVRCVTCGKLDHWGNLDAGHFVSGRKNAILFEDNGIHAQCTQCNIFNHGEQYLYGVYMKKRYGQKEIDRLLKLKSQTKKVNINDYLALIEEYKNKIAALDNNNQAGII